jgi:hypothetical protein
MGDTCTTSNGAEAPDWERWKKKEKENMRKGVA